MRSYAAASGDVSGFYSATDSRTTRTRGFSGFLKVDHEGSPGGEMGAVWNHQLRRMLPCRSAANTTLLLAAHGCCPAR
jgi:hypothetical protein